MAEKILFLTGKLAERQLKRILKIMKPEFSYKISQVGVSVAALMSENIIMRRVSKDKEIDKIIVPGKFRGDLEKLSKFFDVPVERGPDDISHLPDYFGLDSSKIELDEYECDIFAEIVDAAVLDVNEIIQVAKKYVSMGANVIDLGCMPDTDFKHLEDTIFKLKKIGLKVSVDSANSEELIRGGKAGADYLLSVNEKNFHIIDEVDSVPVIIPNTPGDMNSLDRAIKKMIKKKREFLADPILDPIHYGFTDSIVRYKDLRKKYPDIKILMGTGNLTELTDCDSAGANAILMGLVSELSINAVLVVQVSGHCRNSIKETDIARKIMFFSKKNQRLPFGIDNGLMCMSERKPHRFSKNEIKEIVEMVKDRNFRILLGENGINVFNSLIHEIGNNPYDFYEKMKVDNDASHSFYLGVELAKAQIAFELGKNYDQDNDLKWGKVLGRLEENLLERPGLKITQKKK
ncbi:MAG: hypothetical protein CFH30_01066 [Alphaproteobacteria bacterium MarineAlpha8_Bin1]|nr:MAG: hypothetical protein CFH30_01066 [Alphaproteobacteria bacterium MarineAlpha8_Bin1]|tara:strand:+ start:1010 stop:2392 length:1383 start_codon:yes stop_codon:yes gene_type:complete